MLLILPSCQAPMHFSCFLTKLQMWSVYSEFAIKAIKEIKSVIQNIGQFGKLKLQLLYGFANREPLQFCFIFLLVKMDRCDEGEDQIMHNLLAHSHYCFHEISGSGVWRNFFSFGIHVFGRAKNVSVSQNQVVLNIAEKTLLIQVSLTGYAQDPS